MNKRSLKLWKLGTVAMVILFCVGLLAFLPELALNRIMCALSRIQFDSCDDGAARYDCLYATRDIREGEIIDVESVRQETLKRGFEQQIPCSMSKSHALGKKMKTDIKSGHIIEYKDIEWFWNDSIKPPTY